MGVRLGLWAPLTIILFIIDTPFTVIAELWNALRNDFDSHGPCGWMVWSRFLMGGGGLVIAGMMGVLTIAAAAHVTNPHRDRKRHRETGYARLVLPRTDS